MTAVPPGPDVHARPLVTPDAGSGRLMGALRLDFLVDPRPDGGLYEMHEQPVPPGTLVVPHTHRLQDQLSYVLEGTLGVLVGDEKFTVPTGKAIWRPRGVRHALWNEGPGPARMIEITSPGADFAEFVDLFDELTRGGGVSGDAVARLAAPFGITYDLGVIPGLEAEHGVSAGSGWWSR